MAIETPKPTIVLAHGTVEDSSLWTHGVIQGLQRDGYPIKDCSNPLRGLENDKFIAGETFSAADIAAFTITQSVKPDLPWPKLPNLRKWFERIEGRPSVKRGLQAFDGI